MKYLLILTLTIFTVTYQAFAQGGKILMLGQIEQGVISPSKGSNKKAKHRSSLNNVSITVSDNEDIIEQFETKGSSKYRIVLEPNVIYSVLFEREGYVSKIIEVNTKEVTDEFKKKGYQLFTDITLFEKPEGIDLMAYSKLPVAICYFDKGMNSLVWDMKFAQNSHRTFVDIMSGKFKPREQLARYESFDFREPETDYSQELEDLEAIDKHISISPIRAAAVVTESETEKKSFEFKSKLDEPIPAEAVNE